MPALRYRGPRAGGIVSDDPVKRLAELAALHGQCELTDDEFVRAKAAVLNTVGDSQPTAAREPTLGAVAASPSLSPSPTRPAARVSATVKRQLAHDHSKGIWRQKWLLVPAVWFGFMYATVGTAIFPSSALWTGRLLCSSGFHMTSSSSSYNTPNGGGTFYSLQCVNGTRTESAATISALGLQLLLGTIVTYVLFIGIGWLIVRRRNASGGS